MQLARTFATAGLIALAGCGNSQPEISSNYDDLSFTQKAQITIVSPKQGAHVATSPDGMVDVIGQSRGSALLINGGAVTVDKSGNFHARIKAKPGVNVIDAHLSSLWGGEAQRAFIYGDFAAAGTKIASGVLARATAAAYDDHSGDLDDFSQIGKAMLGQVDIMKYVREMPPFTYDFGVGSIDINVTSVQFANAKTALALSPKAAGAHLDGTFYDIAIGLHMVLHFFGDHAHDALVSVNDVGVVGDIDAAYSDNAQFPDPNNPGKFITGPGVVASMETPAIALGHMDISTDISFPGVNDFITWLANVMSEQIANTIAGQVQGNAANHFAAQLNQFGFPSSFDLSPLGVNASVKIADDFDARTSFDDNGATIGAQTAVSWPRLAPGAPGNDAPGSFLVGSKLAADFPPATMAVSVSFDLMNQAAFAVWGQNALARVVYPAKNFVIFKLDQVVATPKLPPILQPTSDGKVQVSLGDIVVTTALHTWIFDGDVQVTISAVAGVALDIDPATGALRMTLTGKPTIYLDVNNLLGIIPDALLAPLSKALQAIAPTIVQNVVKPIEVPLPAFPLANLIQGSNQKLGLAAPVAVAVDVKNQRVTVSGDLAVQ